MGYGIIKAELRETDILMVPHKHSTLVARDPAFGPRTYRGNLQMMKPGFYHSNEYPSLSFKPATTSQSISIVVYDFPNIVKPKIFDKKSVIQLGWIVRTSEGIFANVLGASGKPIADEKVLKAQLKNFRKVKGVYFGNNDAGFTPYESYQHLIPSHRFVPSGDFAQLGLARLLEHAEGRKAEHLEKICATKMVSIDGFKPVNESLLRVAIMGENQGFKDTFFLDDIPCDTTLGVGREDIEDRFRHGLSTIVEHGYAFGVVI